MTMDLVEARKKASKLHRILKSFSGVVDYGKKQGHGLTVIGGWIGKIKMSSNVHPMN